MKKVFFLFVIVLFAVAAFAQEAPKFEVFGGYQYTNVDLKGLTGRQSFNGWNTDVAVHLTKNVSLVGDISGAYKSEDFNDGEVSGTAKLRLYNYLFGPRFSFNAGKVTPFVEALAGISHVTIGGEVFGLGSASTGSNNFGMAIGGGLDVNASKHVAIRLGKFDYMLTRFKNDQLDMTQSENLNNFRYSTGIVFKF